MRTPSAYLAPVGPPPGGLLFAVKYINFRGQTVTSLYRRRASAQALARKVEARGGTAALWVAELGDWGTSS